MGLVLLSLLRHLVANTVGIPKRPYRQLVENAKLQEDVKLGELFRDLLVPEGVFDMGRFGIVLASRVFVEVVEPKSNTM